MVKHRLSCCSLASETLMDRVRRLLPLHQHQRQVCHLFLNATQLRSSACRSPCLPSLPDTHTLHMMHTVLHFCSAGQPPCGAGVGGQSPGPASVLGGWGPAVHTRQRYHPSHVVRQPGAWRVVQGLLEAAPPAGLTLSGAVRRLASWLGMWDICVLCCGSIGEPPRALRASKGVKMPISKGSDGVTASWDVENSSQ